MNDIQKTLHEKLDEEKDFITKIKLAVSEGELAYWKDRKNPPNLPIEDFRVFLGKLRKPLTVEYVGRESEAGEHGKTGETECFQFEKPIGFGGQLKTFYVKGFFFDKDDLKGVEIQSFRFS